jgi:predicted DNA-binding transcriptional regulator YafY
MDRPMPRGDQLTRQWRLLQLIDRAQGITADDAARELAVTIRTIWRDLLVLQDAGLSAKQPRSSDRFRAKLDALDKELHDDLLGAAMNYCPSTCGAPP